MKRKDNRIVVGIKGTNERHNFSRSLNQIVAAEQAEAQHEERKRRFQRRSVSGVFWQHMIDMLMLGGPFAAIILSSFWGYIPDEDSAKWYAIALVVWSIAFVRQHLRFSRFRCRKCDQMITEPELEEGKPIIFRCNRCRIEWDIGFIHGTD